MTASDFTAAIREIGWSLRHVAEMLHCDDKLPNRWHQGRASVPPEIARWLERLAAAHARHPAPIDWRRRGN